MRKAIVSGANGFVGSAVVKELISQGYEVYALVRENHYDQVPINEMVRIVPFSLENIEALGEVIPINEYEAFYHLHGMAVQVWIGQIRHCS